MRKGKRRRELRRTKSSSSSKPSPFFPFISHLSPPSSYILNRGWIDRSERHVPTYEEIIITHNPEKEEEEEEEDTGALSASSFDSLASRFEASYNHRFEEPGAGTIPRFPRTIPSTVRRADTTRKEARERRRRRREEEVERRREEVRVLKALKMREVRRKLEMIGREAGLRGELDGEDGGFVDEALRELDLEGDWSPEKHDRGMAGLFEREGEEDGLAFDEDGKPVWEDDIGIEDIVGHGDEAGSSQKEEEKKRKKKKKKKKKEQGGEEGGAVDVDAMDADVELEFDEGEWDGTEEMRKKVLKRYMDGLDSLDFNDMVCFSPFF